MKQLLGLALVATTVLAAPALAAPEHVRVRGTVTAVSSDMMKVKTSAGDEQTVMLDGNTHYLAVVKSSLDHIEKDSFIGTATKSVGDRMIALEVVIFPPAMKGAGEGHYGWDKIPDTTLAGGASTSSTMTNGTVATVRPSGAAPAVNSTMTNGTVASAATRGSAKTLTVTYKGGEQTILVPPTAPIVSFRPGTMAEVKDGDTVFVNATEDGGKITANAVAVGTDGVKPPM